MSIIELSILYCVHSSSTLLINFSSNYDFFFFGLVLATGLGIITMAVSETSADEHEFTATIAAMVASIINATWVYHLKDLRESRQVVYSRHYCDRHGLWRDNRAGRIFPRENIPTETCTQPPRQESTCGPGYPRVTTDPYRK